MAGPLILNETKQGPWECICCCNLFSCPPHQPFETESGDPSCSACIISIFKVALQADHEWPAKLGSRVLHIEDFASILEPEMLERLLWKRTAMDAEAERLAGLNPSGMEGQVHGSDYQYCPKCKRPISLRDGCNHMTCVCGENFCFRCGLSAGDRSGHWSRQGCPQYGDARLRELNATHTCTRWMNERVRQVNGTFSVEPWAWNVAMQNSDLELRSHMQEFMHRRYQNDETAARPAREHYLATIDAMLAFSRSHGVSERRWARIMNHLDDVDQVYNTVDLEVLYPAGSEQPTGIERGRILTMALYLNVTMTSQFIPGRIGPLNYDHDVISPGNLIRQPVGGVFNLDLEHGRRAAVGWLLNRTLANTGYIADWSGPENYAIFACGPGGTAESRLLGAEIYTALHGRRGRTRMWMPHMRRGVTYGQRHSTQMVVHVSDEQFDMDDRQYHRLVVTTDRPRTPLQEQDASLRRWLFSLFTNPEAILSRIREIYANTPGTWHMRPSTLYMLDAAVEESVNQENGCNGEDADSLSSEPSGFGTHDQATSAWVAQPDDDFDTSNQVTADWVDQLDEEFAWSGAPYPTAQLPALNTQVADEHVEIDRLSTSDPKEEPPVLGVQFTDPEIGTLSEAHVETLMALRATRRQAGTGSNPYGLRESEDGEERERESRRRMYNDNMTIILLPTCELFN